MLLNSMEVGKGEDMRSIEKYGKVILIAYEL